MVSTPRRRSSLPPLPEPDPRADRAALARAHGVALVEEAREYGRHWNHRRWDERSAGAQESLIQAYLAFHRWRIRRGDVDLCADDPWQDPAPDPDLLVLYMVMMAAKSRKWRDHTAAALRIYLGPEGLRRPDLFRLVEIPRV